MNNTVYVVVTEDRENLEVYVDLFTTVEKAWNDITNNALDSYDFDISNPIGDYAYEENDFLYLYDLNVFYKLNVTTIQ